MVIAALAMASLQRISSDVNMRQAHFESILKAGGRIAGPKVECGELNTKPSTFVVTITRCFISEYFNFRMSWFLELIIRIRNLTSTKLKWLLHT